LVQLVAIMEMIIPFYLLNQTNVEKSLSAWGITSSTEQRGIFE